jgi:hypothetical protein
MRSTGQRRGFANNVFFVSDEPYILKLMKNQIRSAARLEFEDGTLEMKPGDWVDIPAHRRHRVAWTTPDEPTVWLAVHYGRPTE